MEKAQLPKVSLGGGAQRISQDSGDFVSHYLNSFFFIIYNRAKMDVIASSSEYMSVTVQSPPAMAAILASETAMAAILASETAMAAIAASETAMAAILASETAMAAILASETAINLIQSKRAVMLATLGTANTAHFNYTDKEYDISNNDKSFHDDIVIPYNCYDDNDTKLEMYFGYQGNKLVAEVAKHQGDITMTSGVSMGGVRLKGVGSTILKVNAHVYNLKSKS